MHSLVCSVDPFPHVVVAPSPHREESSLPVVGEIHPLPWPQTTHVSTSNEILLPTAKVQGTLSADGEGVSCTVLFGTYVRQPELPALNDYCVQQ